MQIPAYLLLPLAAAIVFVVGNLFVKRAYEEGATTTAAFHITNFAGVLVFVPLIFLEKNPIPWELVYIPIGIAVVIYVGALFNFIAMKMGDVSIVVPLLGTKVVFVAIFAVALTQRPLSLTIWIAVVTTSLGIMVMNRGTPLSKIDRRKALVTAALTILSAVAFAFADVVFQIKAREFGGFAFMVLIAITIGTLSLLHIAIAREKIYVKGAPENRWMLIGGTLIALQGVLMASALGFFNDATGVNVVYGSRGLWSLVIVYFFGTMVGNHERANSGASMRWRLIGTLLLTAGIIIAVAERSGS